MMRVIFAAALMLVTALPAVAQGQPRRPFIAINGGVQAARSDLDDRFEFEQHQEQAVVDVAYPARPGLLVDVAGGLRVWRDVGIGVALTHVAGDSTAHVEAAIPHPFHFDRPRNISGERAGAARREIALHLQARYPLPLSRPLEVAVGAGPSFFSVEHDLVTAVQFDETFPYDEATFRAADTGRASGSAVGFNVGADAVWPVGRRFGVGGAIRFVRGRVDVDASGGRKVAVDAGGLQAGVGLRLFF